MRRIYLGAAIVVIGAAVTLIALPPNIGGGSESDLGSRSRQLPAIADVHLKLAAPATPAVRVDTTHPAAVALVDTAEQAAAAKLARSAVGELMDFRERLQSFAAEAAEYPIEDHGPTARALLNEIDDLSARGYVTAPEALALRLSLLRYALPPSQFQAQSEALVAVERERAEAAEREWATKSDPRLERYHAEERRVMQEVATLEVFPDGISRQAYLRSQLSALRDEIFSN